MIVSRKAGYTIWKNLEGYYSRLSVSCLGEAYEANGYFHRLYGGSYYDA